MTEAQKSMTGTGKFLEEKLGHQRVTDFPCPQELISSPGKVGKTQQKAAVQAQTGSNQGHFLNSRAPCYKVTNTKSCHKKLSVIAGQSSTNIKPIKAKDRQPQKVAGLSSCCNVKSIPQFRSHRKIVPHPSFTFRCQADQGPQAALTTVFRDVSTI